MAGGTSGESEVASCLSAEAQQRAAALYHLIVTFRDWVNRRVESVEILDERVARRRVSIDFTLPLLGDSSEATADLVPATPLAILGKTPLRAFDLRDAADDAVPMLTRAQTQLAAGDALIVLAEGLLADERKLPDAGLPRPIQTAVRELVAEQDPDQAKRRRTSWSGKADDPADPDRDAWLVLAGSGVFMDLARQLGDSFPLLAAIDAKPGTRRLIKLAYDEPLADVEVPWWQAALVSVGWRVKGLQFEAPAVSGTSSYHFEAGAPLDLHLDRAELQLALAHERPHATLPAPAEDPMPHPRAHLYTSGVGEQFVGRANLYLRARKGVLVLPSVLAALFVALILTVGYARLDQFSRLASLRSLAAPLFLLVPTIITAVIIRPGEHRLATHMLRGVRLLLVTSTLCSILVGAALAARFSAGQLDAIWLVSMIVGDLMALLLVLSVWLPPATRRPSADATSLR